MKATVEKDKEEIAGVTINSKLNKYDNVILFPEKFALAKKHLKKTGLPKLSKAKHSH